MAMEVGGQNDKNHQFLNSTGQVVTWRRVSGVRVIQFRRAWNKSIIIYLDSTLSLFGRSLHSSALDRTAPFHSVAVQRATPHYSDKCIQIFSTGIMTSNLDTYRPLCSLQLWKSRNRTGFENTNGNGMVQVFY